MADALLAREVLDAEQVKRLAAGLPLDEPQPVAAACRRSTKTKQRPRPKERAPIVPSLNKPITSGMTTEVRQSGIRN